MKTRRQARILELIKEHDIETQSDLLEMLKKDGYHVTQATVSRDIRELNLTKTFSADGRQQYVRFVGENKPAVKGANQNALIKMSVISVDSARNLIVIKTRVGMASAVGSAVDAMNVPEMLGSIAGDDTLMCVMRTDNDALELVKKIKKALISENFILVFFRHFPILI